MTNVLGACISIVMLGIALVVVSFVLANRIESMSSTIQLHECEAHSICNRPGE